MQLAFACGREISATNHLKWRKGY